MFRRFGLACLLSGLMPITAQAQSCAHALVLGLDVSLSVDAQDFALQRQGLSNALLDPAVSDAMLYTPGGHVELAVFEWSGQFDQNLLIDWVVVNDLSTLVRVAQDLRDLPQMGRTGRTGIGAAMLFAHDMMLARPDCARHTLDISGDGPSNSGPIPETARLQMQMSGFIVNALVIENNFNDPEPSASPPLGPYFRDRVITGPGAFTETIFGFDNYEAAIRRKLLRELTPSIATRPRPGAGRVRSVGWERGHADFTRRVGLSQPNASSSLSPVPLNTNHQIRQPDPERNAQDRHRRAETR